LRRNRRMTRTSNATSQVNVTHEMTCQSIVVTTSNENLAGKSRLFLRDNSA
jgi:hypothetical protein